MSDLAGIDVAAQVHGLTVVGVAPVLPDDGLRPDIRSVVLIGPDEPGFWSGFTASPEYADGDPDPLDRWSRRVLGTIACDLGAKAVFPFGGSPYRPFIAWSLRSGRAFQSPVGLLVHDTAGLFYSVRGAIALTEEIAPVAGTNPCTQCPRPCLTACPVAALTGAGYDVSACHAFLDTAAGADCLTSGCGVRRACPVGQDRRTTPQSAFHMKAFHPR